LDHLLLPVDVLSNGDVVAIVTDPPLLAFRADGAVVLVVPEMMVLALHR
jgi:hypothetical protein